MLICSLTIRKDDVKDFKKPKRKKQAVIKVLPSILKGYWSILKLKPVRLIIGASLAYLIANITFSSDRVFFMTFNMGMNEKAISATLLMITIAGVATVPFVSKLGTRFNKKDLVKNVTAVCGVLLMAAKFAGVEN